MPAARSSPASGSCSAPGWAAWPTSSTDPVAIPFAQLPGWPAASAPGHAGRLVLGRLEGVPVACLQGRLHMYEGLSALQVVEPALLMQRLGARTLVLTNAAGGVDPSFEAGTLMLISDHLNLTGRTPLLGPNDDAMGPRFLDLTAVYDPELRAALRSRPRPRTCPSPRASTRGCWVRPTRRPPRCACWGCWAHAVGMSTVMEAIAARWVGMRVVGVSLVTNKGAGISATPLTHDEVLVAANEAGPDWPGCSGGSSGAAHRRSMTQKGLSTISHRMTRMPTRPMRAPIRGPRRERAVELRPIHVGGAVAQHLPHAPEPGDIVAYMPPRTTTSTTTAAHSHSRPLLNAGSRCPPRPRPR